MPLENIIFLIEKLIKWSKETIKNHDQKIFGSRDASPQKMNKILSSQGNPYIQETTHWILLIFCIKLNDNEYSKITGPKF